MLALKINRQNPPISSPTWSMPPKTAIKMRKSKCVGLKPSFARVNTQASSRVTHWPSARLWPSGPSKTNLPIERVISKNNARAHWKWLHMSVFRPIRSFEKRQNWRRKTAASLNVTMLLCFIFWKRSESLGKVTKQISEKKDKMSENINIGDGLLLTTTFGRFTGIVHQLDKMVKGGDFSLKMITDGDWLTLEQIR